MNEKPSAPYYAQMMPDPNQMQPGASYSDAPPTYNQLYQPPAQTSMPMPMENQNVGWNQGGGGGGYPVQQMPIQQVRAYPTQQQPAQNVIITQQVVRVAQVGPRPASIECPMCRQTVTTKMIHETSTKTHLVALVLCLIGCWPCCCLPYCMESCQNANHYCPNCNAFMGSYSG